MAKRFAVYKGLQRPLIYRGFKGKFIYWGLGSLLTGLVTGAITMALVNMYFGLIVLVGIIAGGLVYTFNKQKDGLHNKARASGIHIHETQLKTLKSYGTKNRF